MRSHVENRARKIYGNIIENPSNVIYPIIVTYAWHKRMKHLKLRDLRRKLMKHKTPVLFDEEVIIV